LTDGQVVALAGRLDRLGEWTLPTLRLIGRRPRIAASVLAASLGRERDPFKIDVRKLKRLGLTQSFEVGYELSPRGRALLRRLPRRPGPTSRRPAGGVRKSSRRAPRSRGCPGPSGRAAQILRSPSTLPQTRRSPSLRRSDFAGIPLARPRAMQPVAQPVQRGDPVGIDHALLE